MTFTSRKREYIIDYDDVFVDNGNCIQFSPKDKDKLPFGTWYRRTVYVEKKEWKRLQEECKFEITQDKKYGFVVYYKFKGEVKEEHNESCHYLHFTEEDCDCHVQKNKGEVSEV